MQSERLLQGSLCWMWGAMIFSRAFCPPVTWSSVVLSQCCLVRTQAAGNLPSHPWKGLESLPQGRVLVAPMCVSSGCSIPSYLTELYSRVCSAFLDFFLRTRVLPLCVFVFPSGTWGVGVRPLMQLAIEDRCVMVSFRTWRVGCSVINYSSCRTQCASPVPLLGVLT